MPRHIVHYNGLFGEWSTVVDAPVSMLLSREKFTAYYHRYGDKIVEELPERLARAEKNGTSCYGEESFESLIELNRAGPKESCLTFAQIIKLMTYRE